VLELPRFTNSGTEANLLALSVACAHTARRKIMVFDGAYHGGVLTFGGGGSPGAFGGRADVMSRFDPRRPDALAHAGTFNNNVLTMAAGLAGLEQVLTPEAIRTLNERGENLRVAANELPARGVYMARRGFVALSLPFGDAEIVEFLAALEAVVGECEGVLPGRKS